MARTFEEVAKDNMSMQYAYTNVSSYLQIFGKELDLKLGDIEQALVRDVFDLNTCKVSALDNYWGKIIGLPRDIFLDNNEPYRLNDEQYRFALKIGCFRLSWDGTINKLQNFVDKLFINYGYGRIRIVDNKNMTCSIISNTPLPAWIQALIQNTNIFPRAAGVGKYVIVDVSYTFGFDGQGLETFDNGTFIE